MMNETPPSSLHFSLSEQEDFDHSEVTMPWSDDDDDNDGDENSLALSLEEEDDFDRLIAIKRIGDSNYCDRLDGAKPSPQMFQPTRSSIQRQVGQQIRIGIFPLNEKQQQELIDLKLQLARQQEKVDILSSKCSQYQLENEALKIEKTVLVDALALAKDVTEDRSNSSSAGSRRFSLFGNGGNGGSMQMLIDKNARLMTDNAQLEVSVEGLQKSLRSYIKFSQRSNRADKETIEALKQENESLHQQQQQINPSAPALESEKISSLSEDSTAKTSLESELDLTDDNHQGSINNTPAIDSSPSRQPSYMNQYNDVVRSIKWMDTSSQNTWIIEGQDLEEVDVDVDDKEVTTGDNEVTTKQNRRRSEELLVDFGEARIRRARSRSTARRRHSMVY